MTVTWMQGVDLNSVEVKNILADINTTAATANFTGKVAYSTDTATGIPGALITIAENVGWQDFTDGFGEL